MSRYVALAPFGMSTYVVCQHTLVTLALVRIVEMAHRCRSESVYKVVEVRLAQPLPILRAGRYDASGERHLGAAAACPRPRWRWLGTS